MDLVFYKDLLDCYRLGNPHALRLLLKYYLGQPAALLNVHTLYNDFRSQGISLTEDTLYRYVACLKESYLIFALPVAERSVRKRAVNPRKLHAVDWALGYPFVPEQRIDVGHKLETAVFLHWRRQRTDLGYFGGERGIDLVLHPDRPQAVINVAFSVTQPQTWDRENRRARSGGSQSAGCRANTGRARASTARAASEHSVG